MKKTIVSILAFAVALSVVVHAQQDEQIKRIVKNFSSFRYSQISLFNANSDIFNHAVQQFNPEPKVDDPKFGNAKTCSAANQAKIDDKVAENGAATTMADLMAEPTLKTILKGGCIDYAKYSMARAKWEEENFKQVFIVTTRYADGEPFKVIALLTQKSDSKKLKEAADNTDVHLYRELRSLAAPTNATKNFEEFIRNNIIQGACENITSDAQGLGDEIFWDKIYGLASAVKEDDVAQYVRISEGQAMDYKAPRELIVSPDLISYRDYSLSDGSAPPDSVYNRSLPKFGVELRHGNDAINQPGFFSERVSLNALWGVNRLGIILPTNGLSTLGSSFGVQRRMTYAGFGLNAGFDFPWKVTNAGTGVFHLSGSYVFDDAKQSSHQRQVQPQQVSSFIERRGSDSIRVTRANSLANDYLIRFNAQAHYSFAVGIDSGNFFRFRIGGGVYTREIWQADNGTTREETIKNGATTRDTSFTQNSFTRFNTRFYGGISARVEYMSMYVSTPYGFGLQYFDESVLGEAWLLVPLSQDVGIRFDGRLAAPVLRDAYEWENQTTFVPSMRLIYNF